jgi:Domain of unknown function (DUF3854)
LRQLKSVAQLNSVDTIKAFPNRELGKFNRISQMNNKNFDLDDQLELQEHFWQYDPKQSQHLEEFTASAIDRDIIELNFRSVTQTEAFSGLVRNPDRRNDGRLTDRHLKTFNRLEAGGWICTGIDPLTMNLSEWGCLKPDNPRWDEAKRKHIKYEHPHGVPTELFCLRVTYRIGLKIAKNRGILAETEYLARMVDVDPASEDRGFWQWVKENPSLKITITEGTKKAASLLSAGCLAIGLPGIFGGYRSKINGVDCIPFLIPQLELFATGGREFVFCFDNDTSPKTIANVNTAIDKTGRLLERTGCKVSVVSWHQLYKGVDDLIYSLGEDTYHHAFNDRQSLDDWRLAKDFDISQLPQTKVHTRYLNPTVKPDDLRGKIIAIKSAKNTGKTEYLSKIIQPELERGRPVLIITHRVQLAMNLAQRTGVNHISEIRSDETGGVFGYALCVDSLHPMSGVQFNPDSWDDAIVIIDECEQVLWHLLNSQTCQRNRVAILQTLERLLRNIAQSNGTVILSDADLSKVGIEYLQKMTENQLELWLLTNSYNPNKGKRKLFIHDSPAKLVAAACKAIQKGEKVIIHCSAKQAKSKWAAQHIESLLANKFPSCSILRIDSETVAEPKHPACGCISKLDAIIQSYDIVVTTPTLETGVSIDIKHFDSVWCLANGVQTVDAVCQAIERVRDDVPRHLCITTGGMTKVGNGSDSLRCLLQSQHQVFKANSQLLAVADEIATVDGFGSEHLRTWAKYAAKINQGFGNYNQNILDKLVSEGYELAAPSNIEELAQEELAQEEKEVEEVEVAIVHAKSKNYQAEREGKIGAKNPNDLELKELKQKAGKTKAERYTEAKGNLCRRYLTEDVTHDLITKDDNGWYPQLQLHYYLAVGSEYLKGRDTAKVKGLSGDLNAFIPDVNGSVLSAKVGVLRSLKIEQFFGEDKTFTADSLSDWYLKVTQYRSAIKEVLGVWISPQSTPIQAAQQLLGKLGLKLEYIDRIRIDGKSTRRYGGVDCNPDDRQDVLDRWLDRDNRISRMAECSTQTYKIYIQ